MPSPSSTPVPLQHAVVLRGQRAWAHIKATAAEQRQLWRDIGEALRYGRSLHKADRAFAQWVKEHGFDDIRAQVRSDAMWMAENWAEVYTACNPDISHPVNVRSWFNEQAKDTPPAPELAIESPARLTASIEQVAPVAETTCNALPCPRNPGRSTRQMPRKRGVCS